MKPNSLYFILLSFLFFSFQASAQSLYQDAKALVAASQLLDEKGYDLQDSTALDAFSQMMAILYEYDNPMAPEISNARMAKLANRYRENPRIPNLIPLDSLAATLDSTRIELIAAFRVHSDSLRQAPRQKMVGLLRGDYGDSPAEYLSVSRALREYSVPRSRPLQRSSKWPKRATAMSKWSRKPSGPYRRPVLVCARTGTRGSSDQFYGAIPD
ncbi:MAG: hypothetical protein IPL49_10775 [Saprospirales bacterium]|nr:hypothetical protein [Saprospirales bacterium]